MPRQRARYSPDPKTMPEWMRHKTPIHPPREDPWAVGYRCYRINTDYIPEIIAVLDYYTWPDAFVGTVEERELAASRYSELQAIFMEGNQDCEGGQLLELRQNPNSPCLMQYSTDGGLSWSTAFDYSLCQMASNVINNVQNNYDADQWITNEMVTYSGDITNVVPGWQYGDLQDPNRDAALCYAIDKFIEVLCTAVVKLIEDGETETDQYMTVAAAVTFALGEMAGDLATKGVYPVALGIASVALQLSGLLIQVLAVIVRDSVDPYTNTSAQNELRCWMYYEMAGVTPNFTSWKASASNVLSGDSEIIRQLVQPHLQSDETFVSWLRVLADILEVAKAGDLPNNCQAECDIWAGTVTDFRAVPNASNERFLDSHGHYGAAGSLIANGNGPGASNRVVWTCAFNTDYQPRTCRITYTAVKLSNSDSEISVVFDAIDYLRVVAPAIGVGKDISGGGEGNGRILVIDFDTGLSDGDVEITSLWMAGTGADPFA